MASTTDSELDANRGEKRGPDAAAAGVAVRKEALSCCLQVGAEVPHQLLLMCLHLFTHLCLPNTPWLAV